MSSSRYALVPRGFGRTSYRVVEVMQMGVVPVYIWDDIEWIPYMDAPGSKQSKFAWKVGQMQIGFSANVHDMKGRPRCVCAQHPRLLLVASC